jgi:hypothetical protein
MCQLTHQPNIGTRLTRHTSTRGTVIQQPVKPLRSAPRANRRTSVQLFLFRPDRLNGGHEEEARRPEGTLVKSIASISPNLQQRCEQPSNCAPHNTHELSHSRRKRLVPRRVEPVAGPCFLAYPEQWTPPAKRRQGLSRPGLHPGVQRVSSADSGGRARRALNRHFVRQAWDLGQTRPLAGRTRRRRVRTSCLQRWSRPRSPCASWARRSSG